MLTVGLTGGLATGKSFVAAELAALGCSVINADELGHQVLLPDGEAYSHTIALFGPAILTSDGLIDRKRLAAHVFTDPVKLALLNSLVHPAVRRRERELLAAIEESNPRAIAVIESAILIETTFYRDYNCILLVTCTPALQLERALARPGATLADVQARLARQLPFHEKRKLATFVIDTSDNPASTTLQVRQTYARLKQL